MRFTDLEICHFCVVQAVAEVEDLVALHRKEELLVWHGFAARMPANKIYHLLALSSIELCVK